MTVNRNRLNVSTAVQELHLSYRSIASIIEELQEIAGKYPDASLEVYTEYYGGNEGSPAVRVRATLPESDTAYAQRIKYAEEAEARNIAADLEAYERVKAQIEKKV